MRIDIDGCVAWAIGSIIVSLVCLRLRGEVKERRRRRDQTSDKIVDALVPTAFTDPADKTVLDLMIGLRELTDQEKENLRVIVLKAREHNERNIREAGPAEAIAIANRVYETERYFREKGVNLD